MKPELTRLYSQLDLRPDCSLEELQLAYRRRIARLQPDRSVPRRQSPEDAALLRELVWLYSRANRFHRLHGRLPGAPPARLSGTPERMAPYPPPGPATPPPRTDEPRHALSLPILLGILLTMVALLGLLVVWQWPAR